MLHLRVFTYLRGMKFRENKKYRGFYGKNYGNILHFAVKFGRIVT